MLAGAGLAHGGPIRMLAMPQMLGQAFNPLTRLLLPRAGRRADAPSSTR